VIETEYRIIGIEMPYRLRYENGPFESETRAREEAEKRKDAGDSARIQKRTVQATPWKDVD
jgi:hypothetical protein